VKREGLFNILPAIALVLGFGLSALGVCWFSQADLKCSHLILDRQNKNANRIHFDFRVSSEPLIDLFINNGKTGRLKDWKTGSMERLFLLFSNSDVENYFFQRL